MSRQLALDTIAGKPVDELAHTEYSLNYHTDYQREVTGMEPGAPGAMRAFFDAWNLDFIWSTNDGLRGQWAQFGRATDMGHAAYADQAADQRAAATCPFTEPEEVWAFDAVTEYGLSTREEQIRAYQAAVDQARLNYPNQLTTGGYYKTIVSGAIQAFGWDMLLLALAEPDKMTPVFDSFFRRAQFHMECWAQTDVEVIIQHDDFVWTAGAFMHPAIYREVIIPRYAELWQGLHRAGKQVLFCADGDFREFAGDVMAAGADGLIFEPVNDFGWMVEQFGERAVLVGSYVDCVDLTFGRWDKVQADLARTVALWPRCRGLIQVTGNHLPGNIPPEMMRRYHAACQAVRRRA